MNKRIGYLAALCFIISASSALAAPVFLGADGAADSIVIQATLRSETAQTYRVDVNALEVDTVRSTLGAFGVIDLDGSGFTTAIGAPRLPAIRRLVEIPEGQTATVTAVALDVISMDVEDLTGEARLVPVQAPVVKLLGARAAAPFDLDENAYASETVAPWAALGAVGHMRNHQVAWLSINPVRYNPVTGEVRVARSLRVELKLSGTPAVIPAAETLRYADPRVDAIVRRLSMPLPDLFRSKPASEYGASTYLVIGSQDLYFTTEFQDFVAWKKRKGYDVVFMSTAEAGGTAAGIQATVRDAYETWDRVPSYVLLLGDTDSVPYFIGQGGDHPASDLYYDLVDDADLFPDIGVGRFPARNAIELGNMVDKTMMNDRAILGDSSWVQHAAFLASTDNNDISEGTHNYVIDSFLTPLGYTSDKFYSAQGATTQQVLTDINAGVSLLTYSGHGGVTLWADGPVVEQPDVRNLINTVYPAVFSFACQTGDYSEPESFSETWVRAAGGGVAMFGSSVNSYWDEDDILERVMFEGFLGGTRGDNTLPWLSGMTDYGKMGVWEYYNGDGLSRRYMEMYNIMGDPEPMVLSAPPVTPTLTLNGMIAESGSTLTFTVDPAVPAMLGVTLHGAPIGVGFTDGTTPGVVTVWGSFADGDELDLMVTGHNLAATISTLTAGEEAPVDDDTDDDDNWTGDDDSGDDDGFGDDDASADDDDAADDAKGGDSEDNSDGGGCGC